MVVDDGLGIDGHGVVDGGQDFGGVDGIFQGGGAGLVGLAMHIPALDAGASYDAGVAVGPVVASVGAVGVAAGGDSGSGARAAFAGEVFKE